MWPELCSINSHCDLSLMVVALDGLDIFQEVVCCLLTCAVLYVCSVYCLPQTIVVLGTRWKKLPACLPSCFCEQEIADEQLPFYPVSQSREQTLRTLTYTLTRLMLCCCSSGIVQNRFNRTCLFLYSHHYVEKWRILNRFCASFYFKLQCVVYFAV